MPLEEALSNEQLPTQISVTIVRRRHDITVIEANHGQIYITQSPKLADVNIGEHWTIFAYSSKHLSFMPEASRIFTADGKHLAGWLADAKISREY